MRLFAETFLRWLDQSLSVARIANYSKMGSFIILGGSARRKRTLCSFRRTSFQRFTPGRPILGIPKNQLVSPRRTHYEPVAGEKS